MAHYILSIDQGTTSSRALIFNAQGSIRSIAQQEFKQSFPRDGWVEHDPGEIWLSVLSTCRKAITDAGISAAQVGAIGITNQRETTLLWDRHTGEPVYPAIVWQDRRTAEYCQQLKDAGLEKMISAKTGLLIDPYFSATKLRWMLNELPGIRERAERGELAFGTIDCYLLWQLTGGRVHRTDATNASRTLLFNIHTQSWDSELMSLFDIPDNLLPQVLDSSAHFGTTEKNLLGTQIPVLAIAGDQQAALFGQCCFRQGQAKSTYGTGCFLMLNTGQQALKSNHRLLTTVAYRLNGQTCYALEGSIFMAGATIQWLRDKLQLIDNAQQTAELAVQAGVDHGVYLVPAFTGLGAPYWDPNARGAVFGLTRSSGIKEFAAASLQSVCYQTKDLQCAMEQDGVQTTHLRVDGGMVTNNWMLQFLADMLDTHVDRPAITETTALGVAYLAGLQAGYFDSLDALESHWMCERRFEPAMDKGHREQLYKGWKQCVGRIQG